MAKGVLGVDLGGVVIDRIYSKGNLFYNDYFLLTSEIAGAIDALRLLREMGYEIFIVSKADNNNFLNRTILWLEYQLFYERTGIDRDNVFFCEDRGKKALFCKENGITHLIDDRLEIIGSMVGVVPNLYLFRPRQEEINRIDGGLEKYVDHIQIMNNWQEVLRRLLQ